MYVRLLVWIGDREQRVDFAKAISVTLSRQWLSIIESDSIVKYHINDVIDMQVDK